MALVGAVCPVFLGRLGFVPDVEVLAMRVAIAVPHFFKPDGEGHYGSVRDNPQPRIDAVTRSLMALHGNLGSRQFGFYYGDRMEVSEANQSTQLTLDVLICTRGDAHVLSKLPENQGIESLFTQVPVECEDPKLLGYECHRVLGDRLGQYDYYCYLEDDLMIHDPYFFWKLQWFTGQMGDHCVLQPNRFEVMESPIARKVYIEPDFDSRTGTNEYYAQNFTDNCELKGSFLEQPIEFERAGDPHSGCFFLNNNQMHHWASHPCFLDRETHFIGPLESAATLGLMKAFRVYKPSAVNASFLELQHNGSWNSKFLIENINNVLYPPRRSPQHG